MECQACGKPLSGPEEPGLTCFDCVVRASQAEDDIAAGRVRDAEDVFRELDGELE